MSGPSRAERRRHARGGAAPPPRRDPMRAIYIGFAVVIVLIVGGFAIARWTADHARNAALSYDYATPTPDPSPSAKLIPLQNMQTLGQPFAPTPDPKHGVLPDMPLGGRGDPVDGIPCEASEGAVLHIHSHLSLFYDGTQMWIPGYIGMAPSGTGGCLYWLHTHDASGIIHVEAGDVSTPKGGPFTLGNFFDIWGQPLTRTQIGPFKGNVTAFLNGQPYNGSLADIPLREAQMITLEVGTPVAPPPRYKLPPGD